MTDPIDLYELMPAVHRREDAGLGYPLDALLGIVSTEAGHLQHDIAGLWDDFFIETAREWVIPYIADLVGSRPLHRVTGSWRADVAGTISYRRRKGTLAMLEELAAAVTGWGARVVPFFEELEWAQHLDHLRRHLARAPGRVAPRRNGQRRQPRCARPARRPVRRTWPALSMSGRSRQDAGGTTSRRSGSSCGGSAATRSWVWSPRRPPITRTAITSARSVTARRSSRIDRRRPGVRPSELLDLPGPIRRLALLGDLDAADAAGRAAAAKSAANGGTAAEQAAASLAAGSRRATTVRTSNGVSSSLSATRPARSSSRRSPRRG